MRALSIGLLLVCSNAVAEEPPPAAAPFLTGDEGAVHVATGAFGAKDTMVVVTYDLMGVGSFPAFGLVPDAKAKHGYRRVAVAKLPVGSLDGSMKTALVANLDKDPHDELVIELGVQRSGGNHTYGTVEYVVLDWNGSSFARVTALEAKLAAKMRSRKESATDPLSDADLRAALGVK